jgi:hypothetical protein
MWIDICDREHKRKILLNTDNLDCVISVLDSTTTIVTKKHQFSMAGEEFYHAMILALQGHPVNLGELGHVKPLANEQREEIARRMNYIDAINDTL